MSNMEIDRVLAQIRAISAQSKASGTGAINGVGPGAAGAKGVGAPSEFAKLMSQGLSSVSQAQEKASTLATAFERGTPGVELPQVMLEMQKANVSFRALTEVRNKLVNAYQEIMNMPI
jgi:flagellar hook-basal body complex protein FliE